MSTAQPTARNLFDPVRMHERAMRDVFYRELLLEGADTPVLKRAGLFVDSLARPVQEHPCWNIRVPTTPVGKLITSLKATTPLARLPVVLLSTGSFSPVHPGHLSMMAAARDSLQAQGHLVLGGYLSPSHDEYVSAKQGGRAALFCEDRISLLEETLAEHPWLGVCPWEARYAPAALNFTDVILRLTEYLTHWLGQPVQVAYVFGSDNAGFLDAFRGQGLAVCVERGELSDEALQFKAQAGSVRGARPNWHWVRPTADTGLSSTRIREGQVHELPPKLASSYAQLRQGRRDGHRLRQHYLVRNDLEHGTSIWSVSSRAQEAFKEGLERELLCALKDTHWDLRWLTLDAQKEVFQAWEQSANGAPVLSLDAAFTACLQLQLSRRFELSGGQVRSTTMVARPGSGDLAEQAQALRALLENAGGAGSRALTVVDDDLATGQTQRFVRSFLESRGLRVGEFRYLNEVLLARAGFSGADIADVVDARDFLLGAKDGGLVVQLPDGSLGRAPYMFPFVNLAFRAKLPSRRLMPFSQAMWRVNRDWFSRHAPGLRVRQADHGTRKLLLDLGFSADQSLMAVCDFYCRQLESCE